LACALVHFVACDNRSANNPNIETKLGGVGINPFLVGCEQVEQERCHSSVVQCARDKLIPRAVPAAPAAVHEQNQCMRVFGQAESTGQSSPSSWNRDLRSHD
jgi:hypothetical protein